jgi:hypothetical protein
VSLSPAKTWDPLGNCVAKTAQALPAGTTATLFTVSGTVLVRMLAGLVTTAIQNQACTLSLGVTPTSGSAANTAVCTAGTITNLSIGNLFVPAFTDNVGAAPVIAPVIGLPDDSSAFLCSAGVITWTTSATNTGDMAWYLSYVPVDPGATVS